MITRYTGKNSANCTWQMITAESNLTVLQVLAVDKRDVQFAVWHLERGVGML